MINGRVEIIYSAVGVTTKINKKKKNNNNNNICHPNDSVISAVPKTLARHDVIIECELERCKLFNKNFFTRQDLYF